MNWHSVLVASLLSGLVSAQNPAPPGGVKPAPVKKDRRVDERARDMRDQITEGRIVKTHVRVTVRLSNGNRLTGVVKDGRLVERVDGLRFVEARARERGAGIRLWYSGGTRSYVFVPFANLKGYEIVQRLSQKQLQAIEDEMQMAEKRAAERAAAKARRANGKAGGDVAETTEKAKPMTLDDMKSGRVSPPAGSPGGATGATGEAGQTAEQAGGEAEAAKVADAKPAGGEQADASTEEVKEQLLWSELLRKFPPKMGWNEAKKNEIARRRVVVGANPSKLELEFVDKFDDWMQACEHNGIDPNAAAKKEPQTKRERRRAERERLRGRRK